MPRSANVFSWVLFPAASQVESSQVEPEPSQAKACQAYYAHQIPQPIKASNASARPTTKGLVEKSIIRPSNAPANPSTTSAKIRNLRIQLIRIYRLADMAIHPMLKTLPDILIIGIRSHGNNRNCRFNGLNG